ncbi:hypothetical protein TNCV_4627201 [Trichonephila clavipes]|nr:hypothetical protein TNCV_4627201 [Trichonephila clavipes]
MVYEACLRAENSYSPAQRPERIPTPPVEPERPAEPQRMPTPPAEPEKIPPAELERPPMEMVDPSVSVNTVEVTPPLITRCERVPRQFPPNFMSNA